MMVMLYRRTQISRTIVSVYLDISNCVFRSIFSEL